MKVPRHTCHQRQTGTKSPLCTSSSPPHFNQDTSTPPTGVCWPARRARRAAPLQAPPKAPKALNPTPTELKNHDELGARIIAPRGRAAKTTVVSEAASRAGATAVVMVARRAGSSSPRGRRENVAAAAGCAASATPGPAAATAATNWKRMPGSARRARGAASRGKPTGTTSGACGLLGKSSARRAAGRRCHISLE